MMRAVQYACACGSVPGRCGEGVAGKRTRRSKMNVEVVVTDEELDVFWQALVNSLLLCTAFHFTFRAFFKRYFRDFYYTLDKTQRISLAEKIISTVHGLVVGCMSIKLVWIDNVWEHDIVSEWHGILPWLFGISSGYEIYDMMTMYFQYDQGLMMWLHHICIIVGYQLCLRLHKFGFLTTLLLVTELTVLPSNVHWYLKVFARKDTRAFHFNQGLRLWSFVVLRLFIVPFALYRIWENQEEFLMLPFYAQFLTIFIAVSLGYMNLHWTRTLWMLYRKRERLWQTRLRKEVEEKKARLQAGKTD